MRAKKLLPAILAAGLLMVPAIASAQASKEGVDLRIALNYSHVFFEQNMTQTRTAGMSVNPAVSVFDHSEQLMGFGGTVSIGYKWHYVGLYLDQDLGGVYPRDEELQGYKDTNWHFLGGTYLVVRVSPPVSDIFEMDLGFGAGMMYSDGDALSKRQPTVENPNPSSDSIVPIIINGDGKAFISFSMKASFGFTVYFTDIFGMGLDFDYTIAFNRAKSEPEFTPFKYKVDIDNYVHYLKPGLHFRLRF